MEFLMHYKAEKHYAIVEEDEKLFKMDTRWEKEQICKSQACDPVAELVDIIAKADKVCSIKEDIKEQIKEYLLEDEFFESGIAIYEDAFVKRLGQDGFNVLRKLNLIENCGIKGGRRLYAI